MSWKVYRIKSGTSESICPLELPKEFMIDPEIPVTTLRKKFKALNSRNKFQHTLARRVPKAAVLALWHIEKLGISNLPNHSSPQVDHISLREIECLFPSGQCLQELTCEDATVITVFLLWGVLSSERVSSHVSAHTKILTSGP